MDLMIGHRGSVDDLVDLFTRTFAASEGADEGQIIGALARDVMNTTDDRDLKIFTAHQSGTLVGCILFTQLCYQDDRTVFMLSPVAVAPENQKSGIGQKLINFGLDNLRQNGVHVAVTYGDPNYYIKTGFEHFTTDHLPAPKTLSFPHGWLGQSLTANKLEPLKGPCTCVEAFNNPSVW